MSFKPIDGKRDEFRKYLERTGVLEAISKVFIKLVNCTDRPENAIDFVRANLGDNLQQNDTIETLKRELEDARNEIAQLKRTIETLKEEKSKNVMQTEEKSSNTRPEDEQKVVPATVTVTATATATTTTSTATTTETATNTVDTDINDKKEPADGEEPASTNNEQSVVQQNETSAQESEPKAENAEGN